MKKILEFFGLIRIKDHQLQLTAAKEKIKLKDDSLENAANLSKSLQQEIKASSENMESAKLKIEELENKITTLEEDKSNLKEQLVHEKNINNGYVKNKHILQDENKKLRESYAQSKKDFILLKKTLEGRIGGYVNQLNKYKSQCRYILSILFKEVTYKDGKDKKDTEIFLLGEYRNLKEWERNRKRTIIEIKNDKQSHKKEV